MNEFVNYKKRDIKLPAGCKDLFDLLQQPKLECMPTEGLSEIKIFLSQLKQQPQHDYLPTEGLSDAKRYLTLLMEPPGKKNSLWIDSLNHSFAIGLSQRKGALSGLILLAKTDLEALHKILNDAGIRPTRQAAYEVTGPITHCIICPLPTDLAAVTNVIDQILRKGFALPEQCILLFRWSRNPPKGIPNKKNAPRLLAGRFLILVGRRCGAAGFSLG